MKPMQKRRPATNTNFGAIAQLAKEESTKGNVYLQTLKPRKITVSPRHKKPTNFNPGSPGSDAEDDMLDGERPKCILEPDAPFKMMWDMTMLILIVYNVFSVPVAICFSVRCRATELCQLCTPRGAGVVCHDAPRTLFSSLRPQANLTHMLRFIFRPLGRSMWPQRIHGSGLSFSLTSSSSSTA